MVFMAWLKRLAMIGFLTIGWPSVWGDIQPDMLTGPATSLTGDLTTDVWAKAKTHSLGKFSGSGQPSVATDFKMLQDENGLYVGVTCMEPLMDKVRADRTERDQKLSDDDCIEIFIDPSGSSDRYYQFLINSLGTQQDNEIMEGGRAGALGHGHWQVAVKRLADRWTAEVFIPWATLNSWTQGRAYMGLNVARERYASGSQELFTWSKVTRFHDPANFTPVSGLLVRPTSLTNQIGPISASVSRQSGDPSHPWKVQLTAKCLVQNRDNGPWRFSFHDQATGHEWVRASVEPSQAVGQMQVVDFPTMGVAELKPLHGILEIRQADGKLIACRRAAVPLSYAALSVELIEPGYRQTIYASQTISAIRGRVTVNESEKADASKLMAVLQDAQGKIYAQQELDIQPRVVEFQIPCHDLKPGRYQLAVHLQDVYGQALHSNRLSLSKVPAPAPGSNEVRIDEERRILLNGKPFAALGWFAAEWIGSVRHGYEWYPKEVNFFHNNREQQNDPMFQAGKYFTLSTPKDYKEMRSRDEPSEAIKEQVHRYIQEHRHHPGLLAWYLADEPEIHDSRPQYLENYYRLIAQEDPYHPCWIIHNSTQGVWKYENASDIAGMDPYYLPETTSSLDGIMRFAQTVGTIKGKKPVWATLMAFGHYHFAFEIPSPDKSFPVFRAPNYRESRAMHLYMVMAGVQGFADFETQYAYSDPVLRLAIPAIQKEIHWLEPYVLASSRGDIPVRSDHAQVQAAGRQVGNRHVVIAVNTQAKPCRAKIQVGSVAGKLWGVLSENRTVVSDDAVIDDSFAPFDVHVYSSDASSLPNLPTVNEIQSRIDGYAHRIMPKSNVARMENIASVRGSNREYSVLQGLFDGITDGLGWWSLAKRPAWLEVTFKDYQQIGRLVLYTPDIRKYEVSGYDGRSWAPIASAQVPENPSSGFVRLPVRSGISFPVRKLLKVRIQISDNQAGEINEWWMSDGQELSVGQE